KRRALERRESCVEPSLLLENPALNIIEIGLVGLECERLRNGIARFFDVAGGVVEFRELRIGRGEIGIDREGLLEKIERAAEIIFNRAIVGLIDEMLGLVLVLRVGLVVLGGRFESGEG